VDSPPLVIAIILMLIAFAAIAVVIGVIGLIASRLKRRTVNKRQERTRKKGDTGQDAATSPSVNLFCTNCGNSISGQAMACLSCGASPIGHKRFCRQCGVGLNPEQIICVKCGVGLADSGGAPTALQAQVPGISLSTHSLSARQRKARINFWTMLCAVFFMILVLATIFSHALEVHSTERQGAILENAQARAQEGLLGVGPGWFLRGQVEVQAAQRQIQQMQEGIGRLILVLLVFTGIPYLCCYYFYLHRLWEEIPEEFARTTPGNAAGFALIPIFNLYWQFVVFSGLYRNMKEAAKSYSISSNKLRAGHTGIVAVCVLWLILGFVALLIALASMNEDYLAGINEDYVALLSLLSIGGIVLNALITIPAYWLVRKDVLTFIDLKESVGK